MSDSDAREALRSVLADRRVTPEGVALRVLRSEPPARPGFVDRLIHGRYRDSHATLVTFDAHAARLPGSRLLGRIGR